MFCLDTHIEQHHSNNMQATPPTLMRNHPHAHTHRSVKSYVQPSERGKQSKRRRMQHCTLSRKCSSAYSSWRKTWPPYSMSCVPVHLSVCPSCIQDNIHTRGRAVLLLFLKLVLHIIHMHTCTIPMLNLQHTHPYTHIHTHTLTPTTHTHTGPPKQQSMLPHKKNYVPLCAKDRGLSVKNGHWN